MMPCGAVSGGNGLGLPMTPCGGTKGCSLMAFSSLGCSGDTCASTRLAVAADIRRLEREIEMRIPVLNHSLGSPKMIDPIN